MISMPAFEFSKVPRAKWPPHSFDPKRIAVWLSGAFLVQGFSEEDGVIRLTINCVTRSGDRWKDGISWDDLQAIKSAVGYGDKVAVEVFPEDHSVVNVANMRHLWVLPDRPKYAWTQARTELGA